MSWSFKLYIRSSLISRSWLQFSLWSFSKFLPVCEIYCILCQFFEDFTQPLSLPTQKSFPKIFDAYWQLPWTTETRARGLYIFSSCICYYAGRMDGNCYFQLIQIRNYLHVCGPVINCFRESMYTALQVLSELIKSISIKWLSQRQNLSYCSELA